MTLAGALTATVTGSTVTFEFAITNVGEDSVAMKFRSGKEVDVAVQQDGREVWRWSEGRMFTQAIHEEILGPGEEIVHELEWTDPSAGEYTAVASLAASNHTVTDRVDIVV